MTVPVFIQLRMGLSPTLLIVWPKIVTDIFGSVRRKELYCLDLVEDMVINGNDLLNIGWGYYNSNASLKTKDGHLAFGTAEGALFLYTLF